MKLQRLAVALTAVTILSSSTAFAQGVPRGIERGLPHKLAIAMARAYEQSVGIPAGALQAGTDGSAGYVFPALDYTGDGQRDMLAMTFNYRTETSSYEALDAKTGTRLFGESFDGLTYPLPASVGADAIPGVLLVGFSYTFVDVVVAGTAVFETTITAVDGQGNDAWEHVERGIYADGIILYLIENYGFGAQSFNGLEGDATDMILYMGSERYDPLSSDRSYRIKFLDGTDGSVASEESRKDGRGSSMRVGPDLDGDGLNDLLLSDRSDGKRFLRAERATDRSEIWETALRRRASFRSVGDLNNDGIVELLGSSSMCCYVSAVSTGEVSLGRSSRGPATLIDGRKGKVIWTRKAPGIHQLGDIDGDGGRDLGLQEVHYRGSRIGVTYSAITWQGKEVYSRFYGIEGSDDVLLRRNSAIESVGDVNGDGFADGHHSISLVDIEKERFFTDDGFVSGKTGDKLWDGEVKFEPLRDSLDGNGDDFLDVKRSATQVELTIKDGRDGSVVWDRAFPAVKRRTFVGFEPLWVGAEKRVLLNLFWYRSGAFIHATYLLDAGSGQTVWTRA